MNDVLQFSACKRELPNFPDDECNRKFVKILQAEGYIEEYQNASMENNKNRLEAIVKVAEKVSARAQAVVPPVR